MSTSVSQSNNTYNFYPTWVPSADDWMAMFGGKVDANNGWLTNPTVLGAMTLANPPNAPSDAANKGYVDSKLSGSTIPDAPSDGTPYCRMNSSWVPAPTTITASVLGDLLVPGNLTVGLNTIIDGSLQLGTVSNGPYKLDVNGNINVIGSGRFVVDSSTTWLTITANPTAAVTPLPSTSLEIVGGPGLPSRISLDAFASVGVLSFRTASGTAAAPTALLAAQSIANLNYFGHDGVAYSAGAAAMLCRADSLWSPTNHATHFAWQTTPTGTIAAVEGMRLLPSGALSIGPVANLFDQGFKLDVKGGPVRINLNTGNGAAAVTDTALWLVGADTTSPRMLIDSFGGNSQITMRHAQGTAAAPTVCTVSTNLGVLNYNGYDGTAFTSPRASWAVQCDANWAVGSNPTRMTWNVTPNGSVTPAEAMRLQASGNLSLGTTADVAGYRLNVVGGSTQLAYVNSTAPVILQGNTGLPIAPFPSGTALVVLGPDTGAVTRIFAYGFGGVGASTFAEFGSRAARGTNAVPVIMQNNDILARFSAAGYSGIGASGYSSGLIQAIATENWGPTNTGLGWSFQGMPNGGTVLTESIGIRNGNVGIGVQSDWGYRLDVGSLTLNSRVQVTTSNTVPTGLIISGLTVAQTMPPLPPNCNFMITGSSTGTAIRQAMLVGNSTAVLSFLRTGGPLNTPTATGTQPIGGIEALGYDTTWTTTPNANVNFVSAGTWSATSHPAYTTFGTTPIGSITMAEAGRFSPNGNLLLGTVTDGAIKLDVVGTARVSGGIGVFGHAPPTSQPSLTGAKGGNTALASVIAVLVAAGIALDTTTA